MKQLEKMSLANVRNKLTRKEMSNIMAGSGWGGSAPYPCQSDADCRSICERSVAYCANTNGVKNCQFCCYS